MVDNDGNSVKFFIFQSVWTFKQNNICVVLEGNLGSLVEIGLFGTPKM